MTVIYPNGTVLKAIVLSHEDHDIRAVAAGCEDVLAFTCIHGTWTSEGGVPVTIEFEWQRHGAPPDPSDQDCICSKELAARLIQTLLGGGELDAATGEAFYVFMPEGSHVAACSRTL